MKYILSILSILFCLVNASGQEIVRIDTAQYLVTYTPLPEAITKTENAIAGIDRQIQKINDEIQKEVTQLKALQTKKIELETALKIMQNPAPSKSVSTKSAPVPSPTPPGKKTTPKKGKKPRRKGPIKKE